MRKILVLPIVIFVLFLVSFSSVKASDLEVINSRFSKNDNYYFYEGYVIENIDYESVEVLSIRLFKDKNDVYDPYCRQGICGYAKFNADPETFQIYLEDDSSIGYNGFDKGAFYYSDCYMWRCYPVTIPTNTENFQVMGGYIKTIDSVIWGGG